MTKIGFSKVLVLLFIAFPSFGQKVKYKDIFALLSTKQYEQAEPFLKRYLVDNDDNPNAFLYRGIIFQEKSAKSDVLKQTPVALAHIDSALLFFDKALKSIDDREVRKNKEYYQVYNRRDLRTGEFGVKLSDIQFDIEKRIESLKEKSDKIKMIKHYFSLSDSLYKKSNALYRTVASAYSSERQLLLRADHKSTEELRKLSVRFDSCRKAFESYLTSAQNLGKMGYNHTLDLQPIANFPKDGISLADFYQEDLKLWNYKEFADRTVSAIEKEIVPMRDHLITYDVEINKLRDKLNTDSVSVKSDLTKLIDKLLYDRLKKFDDEPLPMEVFSLKTADLEYRSALLEHKAFKDSADIRLQLALINTEVKLLDKLDSIAKKLTDQNIDDRAKDYEHFITNTYSSPLVLKSYVNALREYAHREKDHRLQERERQMKSLSWIVDGADSIPLAANPASNYKSLQTIEEKYTIGINVRDTTNVNGYFYTVTPSRKAELKIIFPVDKTLARDVSRAHVVSYTDGVGHLYVALLYSDVPAKEKYRTTLAKIYRSDGLAWSNNIELSFLPKEITLRPDTGEITIKNETQQTVVDKNGKVVR